MLAPAIVMIIFDECATAHVMCQCTGLLTLPCSRPLVPSSIYYLSLCTFHLVLSYSNRSQAQREQRASELMSVLESLWDALKVPEDEPECGYLKQMMSSPTRLHTRSLNKVRYELPVCGEGQQPHTITGKEPFTINSSIGTLGVTRDLRSKPALLKLETATNCSTLCHLHASMNGMDCFRTDCVASRVCLDVHCALCGSQCSNEVNRLESCQVALMRELVAAKAGEVREVCAATHVPEPDLMPILADIHQRDVITPGQVNGFVLCTTLPLG
jgi:hypothetical protein